MDNFIRAQTENIHHQLQTTQKTKQTKTMKLNPPKSSSPRLEMT